MEDTLRDQNLIDKKVSDSLNPCFNGRYSQRIMATAQTTTGWVLILVLMEDTLREQRLVSLCISSFDVCLPLWK